MCGRTIILLIILSGIALLISACAIRPVSYDGPPSPPRGYKNEKMLRLAVGLRMLKLVDVEPPVPENIESLANVEYRNINSLSLQLDIYR